MTSTFTVIPYDNEGTPGYMLVETREGADGMIVPVMTRRYTADELAALRTAVMSAASPMTSEQINALPAAKGWWGFAVARRVVAVIRDVEAFYGVRR